MASEPHDESVPARFFDSRAAYLMFTTATNEKPVIAERIGDELEFVSPGHRALRIFDAGMGDASVLTRVMRRMHRVFPYIPWLVVGKEISIEDVRLALDRLPDRFAEHPELVVVITNMYTTEATSLTPGHADEMVWREVALDGGTTDDFGRQIHELFPEIADDWEVVASEQTGNPRYVRPSVVVLYRKDRRFLLEPIIPAPGAFEGEYDLIVASQPYRARTSIERKIRLAVAPLAKALAPGGRMIIVHSHGNDPGLDIIRGVWPDEEPFVHGRADVLAEARRQLDRPADQDLRFSDTSDDEAIFRYDLHAMPSEVTEHIGTGLTLAAWNAAAYVAQIDEDRLAAALESGAYVDATQRVLQREGGVWFNDEAFVIARKDDHR